MPEALTCARQLPHVVAAGSLGADHCQIRLGVESQACHPCWYVTLVQSPDLDAVFGLHFLFSRLHLMI